MTWVEVSAAQVIVTPRHRLSSRPDRTLPLKRQSGDSLVVCRGPIAASVAPDVRLGPHREGLPVARRGVGRSIVTRQTLSRLPSSYCLANLPNAKCRQAVGSRPCAVEVKIASKPLNSGSEACDPTFLHAHHPTARLRREGHFS